MSANGKSNIYRELISRDYRVALVIADGAAFGPEIERVLSLKKARSLILYLPESFEWIVLNSKIIKNNDIDTVLAEPSQFIESEKYFSWERFFTAMLTDKTNGTYLQYNKSSLNPAYLQENEQSAIIDVVPEIVF